MGSQRMWTRYRGLARGAALVLVALAAAAPLRAATGFVIEEELETATSTGRAKLERSRTLLHEGKLRKEQLPAGNITIVRDDSKLVWILDPARRTYFEIARSTLERMGAAGAAALPATGGDVASSVHKTGEHRRIGKFDAYEVRVDDQPVAGARLTMWLSTEVPIDRTLEGPFGRGGLSAGSPVGRLLESLRELPGYPVEVILSMHAGGQTMTVRQTVTSIVRAPLSDDVFAIPGGYTRIASPLEDETGTEAAPGSPAPTPSRPAAGAPPARPASDAR